MQKIVFCRKIEEYAQVFYSEDFPYYPFPLYLLLRSRWAKVG